tara:strand:- start:2821 stop:3018 length:198 start_codon:yes stop_codon:yes gene_type:complete
MLQQVELAYIESISVYFLYHYIAKKRSKTSTNKAIDIKIKKMLSGSDAREINNIRDQKRQLNELP